MEFKTVFKNINRTSNPTEITLNLCQSYYDISQKHIAWVQHEGFEAIWYQSSVNDEIFERNLQAWHLK
jgi:hypothetical protein